MRHWKLCLYSNLHTVVRSREMMKVMAWTNRASSLVGNISTEQAALAGFGRRSKWTFLHVGRRIRARLLRCRRRRRRHRCRVINSGQLAGISLFVPVVESTCRLSLAYHHPRSFAPSHRPRSLFSLFEMFDSSTGKIGKQDVKCRQ